MADHEKPDLNNRPSGTRLTHAMVLAAGLGTRMRPITDATPKPLVRVCSKPLIDHALDAIDRADIPEAVVNVHYLADELEAHLKRRTSPKITISDERKTLLDSGGGVVNALPLLGENPFLLMNADSFWMEGATQNIPAMAKRWDDDKMDVLLLLAGMAQAIGYDGKGDFDMDPEGRLARRPERKLSAFAYCGAAIFHPRVFADAPTGPFSLNRIFDQAIERERLFGMRLDGVWLHVGTPEAIGEAESAIARSAA